MTKYGSSERACPGRISTFVCCALNIGMFRVYKKWKEQNNSQGSHANHPLKQVSLQARTVLACYTIGFI